MFKFHNNLLICYVDVVFTILRNVHNYSYCYLPRAKTNYRLFSIKFSFRNSWNKCVELSCKNTKSSSLRGLKANLIRRFLHVSANTNLALSPTYFFTQI